MAIWQIISWWYSLGFGWVLRRISKSLDVINKTLAVNVLIKTLFAPWKQITSNYYRVSFIQKMIDNSVSRLVGFVMRFFVLIGGGVWALITLILGLIWLILWPFIPLMVLILPILAIKGVGV